MVKGFVKTLEASIAIVLILASITFIAPERYLHDDKISEKAYWCLTNLDESGKLRYYSDNSLESEMNSDIRSCIPSAYNYSLRICYTASCIGYIPENKPVYTANYLISGGDVFRPSLTKIWLWSK
jgi:hypothetical protein